MEALGVGTFQRIIVAYLFLCEVYAGETPVYPQMNRKKDNVRGEDINL